MPLGRWGWMAMARNSRWSEDRRPAAPNSAARGPAYYWVPPRPRRRRLANRMARSAYPTLRRHLAPRRLVGHAGSLDVELREDPVEPARDPTRPVAEYRHQRRHEAHPDQGGVDEHRERHADGQHLDGRVGVEHEAAEDD